MLNLFCHRRINLCVVLFLFPLVLSARTVSTVGQLKSAPANSTCEIKNVINLKGEAVSLQPNITIVFRGGSISGGTLIGNDTRIGMGDNYFKDVVIKGTWQAPMISTSMFTDLSKVNALRNVIALTNPRIYNTVIIEEGTYWVDIEDGPGLVLSDNVTLHIGGTIKLKANSKTGYNIVSVKGRNITICGDGEIVGDRDIHLGDKGEWGMGIILNKADNVIISGLKISKCWGDGIYVYGKSERVQIYDCDFSYCRRQGISITDANDVIIKDCSFSNIGGTSPGLAIDVEPNADKSVKQVFISGIKVKDCEAGVSVSNRAKGSSIGEVTIKGSSFVGAKKNYSVLIAGAKKAIVDSCYIDAGHNTALWLSQVDSAYYHANTIISSSKEPINKYKCKKIFANQNEMRKR